MGLDVLASPLGEHVYVAPGNFCAAQVGPLNGHWKAGRKDFRGQALQCQASDNVTKFGLKIAAERRLVVLFSIAEPAQERRPALMKGAGIRATGQIAQAVRAPVGLCHNFADSARTVQQKNACLLLFGLFREVVEAAKAEVAEVAAVIVLWWA